MAPKLFYMQRYAHLPRHGKKASKALKQLSTLSGRQVRDLQRKLEGVGKLAHYQKQLSLIEVESVFGQVKMNMDYRRLLLRGEEKVSTELGLVYLWHNVKKLSIHLKKEGGKPRLAA